MSTDIMGHGYQALDDILAEHDGLQEYIWLTPYEETVEATRGLFAGIRAYPIEAPVPHWHYVTFGFSDLGDKDSPDPELSGYGFELTCRVPWVATRNGGLGARTEPPTEAPSWPFSVLAHLARYIFQGPRWFEEGHHYDLQGSVDGKGPLTALIFAADPILQSAVTHNGRVDFLQIVGLHEEELTALKSWQSGPFLEILRERDPLLLTDPARPSLFADSAVAERVREGIARDGSSQAAVFGDEVGWIRVGAESRVEITLDASTAFQVREAIPRMLRKGRPFICMGNLERRSSTVVFVRADRSAWFVDDQGGLVVQLADDLLDRFEASLTPPAILEWPDLVHLKLRVLPADAG